MNSLAALPSSILQTTTTMGNSALKAVNSVSNSALKAVNSVSSSTTTLGNGVVGALNSGVNSMHDTFHDVVDSTTTLLHNVPILNSLVGGPHTNSNSTTTRGSNSMFSSNTSTSTLGLNSSKGGWAKMIGTFFMLVILFLTIFILFKNQIKTGLNNLVAGLRRTFGQPSQTQAATASPVEATAVPSKNDIIAEQAVASKSIINKILPSMQKEVFNVSENEYTYYDAEPLCRALGAELATYSQVKEAWDKGADWCNYGWVKGQAAVYPTQKNTWDKLQHGPEDEKSACGTPGVNGGYFDNPEMRFGVSCYGVKPAESSNDEKKIMARGTAPRTPATLKVDQQIEEYKKSLDTIGLLPFSPGNWSE